ARSHERRRRLLEADPLTELVVIVVDLASTLGGDDYKRVAGIDVLEQLIDAWMDHGETWYLRRATPVGRCRGVPRRHDRRRRSRSRDRTRFPGRARSEERRVGKERRYR